MINSINGHESLFMIETNEPSIIFKLPSESVMSHWNNYSNLNNQIDLIFQKFNITGIKYDVYCSNID